MNMNPVKWREVATGLVLRSLPPDGVNLLTLKEIIACLNKSPDGWVRTDAFERCGEPSLVRFIHWLKTKRIVRVEGPSYYLTTDVPDRLLAKVTVFPTDRRDAVLARMTPHAKAHLELYKPNLLDVLAFVSV